MEPRVDNFLTMKTSLRDMKQFLQRWATTENFRTYSIPIVDSPGKLTLGELIKIRKYKFWIY